MSSMNAFWYHYATEFAISVGWDFEQDLRTLADENPKYADSVAFTIKESGIDIMEHELVSAAFGTYSENLMGLLEKWYDEYGHMEPGTTLISSMHSGSSDYLTVKKLKDFLAKA